MLGRVYTFEQATSGPRAVHDPVSTGALSAIRAAMQRQRGIRYEELTDPENPHAMFAILFDRWDLVSTFDRQLRAHLQRSALRVSVLETSIGRATPRTDAPFDAAQFAA